MSAARSLLQASLVALGLSLLCAVLGVAEVGNIDWWAPHAPLAIVALLAGFGGLTAYTLQKLMGRLVAPRFGRLAAAGWLAGGLLLAVLDVVELPVPGAFAAVALLALAVAAVVQTVGVLQVVPKRKESVVDVVRDPLTKGDDACSAQLRFASFLLPLPLLLLPVAVLLPPGVGDRLGLAATHLALAGYGLFSTYALSHLWVPRLSGVPAIAAGAIKGELHTSLLGLLFLAVGFGTGLKGLVIAGGAFLFFGAFTWMGVLGANIMRNKSKTQRVTPEFAYIPWAFTGVFWLLSGVLLGIFLNVVPDLYAANLPGLRFAHVHIALYGGFVQVLVALAIRLVPAHQGRAPAPFSRGKWGFYGLNAGLAIMLYAHLGDGVGSLAFRAGALLSVLGLAAAFLSLPRHAKQAEG